MYLRFQLQPKVFDGVPYRSKRQLTITPLVNIWLTPLPPFISRRVLSESMRTL